MALCLPVTGIQRGHQRCQRPVIGDFKFCIRGFELFGLLTYDSDKRINELMVHVHFDAKYRVANVWVSFSATRRTMTFSRAKQDPEKRHALSRKYGDLLNMYADRDAVRRSAGAYVLYPGEPDDGQLFRLP